jgi:CHASE3 domain sensor protein
VIATTFLAAAITLTTFWSGGRAQNEDQWIRHTLAVRGELQMIHALVLQAESSQRGYLLTRRGDYLSRFDLALQELQNALDRTAALVRDNPGQIEAIAVLRQHISKKFGEMRKTIEDHDAGHADAALALVNSDQGERETTVIRDQINSMVTTEDRLLTQREAAAASFIFMLQLGSVAAFLLIGGAGLLVAEMSEFAAFDIGRAHSDRDGDRGRAVEDQCRRPSARECDRQRGPQCARRDARRWQADDRNRQRLSRRGLLPRQWRGVATPIRDGRRHRRGAWIRRSQRAYSIRSSPPSLPTRAPGSA